MSFLLDTHVLIWALDEPAKLSARASQVLQDPAIDVFVSPASIWEIALKVSINKLRLSQPFGDWLKTTFIDFRPELLHILPEHVEYVARMPFHHRDPFDRMLVAQSAVSQIPLLSCDAQLSAYGVQLFW
ncbi:MAG: type II toxin-antitoxin system VapC family toxin [Planctomycetales bacterium]|nr:type II toxin-antitoxin system VapC family toxin [Planctomycetales bacterium]MBN8625541.1 type II toxin-antitoxin system VapC family toxin [Planctomycetota bacterium]